MLCDFLEKIDERRRGAVKQYFLDLVFFLARLQ
jgi:hypothetical protein